MEQAVFPSSRCQLSLRNILSVHEQPVCEEQAWALCYQLCSLLERNFSLEDGQIYSSWKSFRLPGPEGIFLSPDGNISLRIEHGKVEHQFVIETEAQTVDYVGRLMYSCLDWGLGADVERELDETLELLVDQMTKVDIRLGAERCLQPICTISEVLQVCEERLYNPRQATQHYRSVCATLYSHTIELCNYLQIIEQTQESLQKLIMESENNLVPDMTTNWEFTWKHLMDELSRGVVLRPPRDKLNAGVPLPVDVSPFSQLLQDIQLRRYTLRKVKALENARGGRGADPHQTLLDIIRAGPKLRPVSERKLKPRVQNLKHEVSLHELLMQEIRSTDPGKLLSSCQKRRPCKETVSGSLSLSTSPVKSLTSVYEDTNEDMSFFLNAAHSSSQEGAPCRETTCKDGSAPQEDSYTGSSVKNLSFSPALSSTPLSLSEECRLFRGKRRARSLPSNLEVRQLPLQNKVSVPTTIADVIKTHYRKEGKSSCDAYGNWRICSCCAKRSLYFTWHNFCSLCSRVVCPECCLELRLPFKWCINLPISFFKKIVLKKESEESQRHFWNERWSWDPSRVPLVLASSRISGSVAPHTLAMRDWHNQDMCVGCQGLLLEACDSPAPPFTIKAPQEI
ncbi:protein spire homolog 1 isoform X2 [Pangasianodon hypophthalmus]|uniref:protein spire homolog 1 isoform X2 n=1 Tax=Pangasianodon hypophthalmus TaxID=310915 RepID=UPI0023082948|nr:protein spire homolog 1 isoform X2 [Pangasianodon hypophthalmus]